MFPVLLWADPSIDLKLAVNQLGRKVREVQQPTADSVHDALRLADKRDMLIRSQLKEYLGDR